MSTQPPLSRDPSSSPGSSLQLVGPEPTSSGNEGHGPLVQRLSDGFVEAARRIAPWFSKRMPAGYFQDTLATEQEAHLRAIIAARASAQPIAMSVRSRNGNTLTFLREGYEEGLMGELLAGMPADERLRAANVYAADDRSLVVAAFHFGDAPRFNPDRADLAEKRARVLEHAIAVGDGDPTTLEALGAHFEASSYDYLRAVGVKRIWEHFMSCRRVAGGDGVEVRLQSEATGLRLDVTAGNASPPRLFQRVSAHLGRHRLFVRRAHLDVFAAPHGTVANLGIVLDTGEEGLRDAVRRRLVAELERLCHVDESVIALAYRHPDHLDLVRAEIAVALAHLTCSLLGEKDALAYSRERLLELIDAYPSFAARVAEVVRSTGGPDAHEAVEAASRGMPELVGDARSQRALEQLLDLAQAVRATNLAHPRRWGLAVDIAPAALASADRPCPHRVFFVHGRGFDAFHVRFRDVARGGMRVVVPRGPDQHASEARKFFAEAHALAFAQQLKNKDIPEGGAKGVILIRPGRRVDGAVRGFVDGLLDLVLPLGHDPSGATDLVYLGPDENISDELIEWTVERAEIRGYPLPNAFMSSKPGAGINHKHYGVTSEGVIVFLEEALAHVGIDPRREEFTIKLTGGPDGDVAGNAIRIMIREYGSRCRIVGIADGSGVAMDPEGLCHESLLCLVATSRPIAEFPPTSLSERGSVFDVQSAERRRRRDRLHHDLETDAFVPAGGRPATINEDNWRDQRHGDGVASRVIVEGANLFLTASARRALSEELDVTIIKDSSANKCGVICSSFEILACMLLEPDELVSHKDRFVSEVLDRLRELAKREARLLFAERRRQPQRPLPDLSIELSLAIERVADAVFAAYPQMAKHQTEVVEGLVRGHLPPVLAELAADRLGRLPDAYRAGIVAATLATRVVYREGLSFVQQLPDDELAALAERYYVAERESQRLAAIVRGSDIADRERIAALLEQGGPRAGLLDGA